MSAAEKWTLVSVEEEFSPVKREYYGGFVHPRGDMQNAHNHISGNALGLLHSQLRGRPCQPCNSDTKIRIRLLDGTRFYYPDAVIDLPEIGASLALADLYERASFEDETTDLFVSEEDID